MNEECEHKALALREDGYRCVSCWEPVGTGERRWMTIINYCGGWDRPEIHLVGSRKEAFSTLRSRMEDFVFQDETGDDLHGDEFTSRYSDDELVGMINKNPYMDGWSVDVRSA